MISQMPAMVKARVRGGEEDYGIPLSYHDRAVPPIPFGGAILPPAENRWCPA